ncbi:MAG: phenylacetic acid degradation protein PaaD [Robiginitomaculum sp.]|nr:MAG: phenylacetic acid degradation protein PaaD [Robiginitomaculum sp.]
MDAQGIARKAIEKMLAGDGASRGLGMVLEDVGAGFAKVSMVVRDDMVNGHKSAHGGMIFSLADTAFACACNSHNIMNVASTCQINFVRPVMLGDTLTAVAKEQNLGKRTGLYDVEVCNCEGKIIAFFRGQSMSLNRPVFED